MKMTDTKSLFRIVSFEGFMSLLENNKERFVNPLSWEDTHEGCGLRYAHENNNVIKLVNALWSQYNSEDDTALKVLYNFVRAECVRDYCFCQCWSLNSDSDAMWRIYNYNNHAIQIESNKLALLDHINFTDLDGNRYITRIKTVKYDVNSEDRDDAYIRFYQKGMDFTESFFHKRAAFKHENEVRLLFHHKNLRYVQMRKQNEYRKRIIELLSAPDPITADNLSDVINVVHAEQADKYSERRRQVELDVLDMSKYITGVRVHPLAEEWYVKLIEKICSRHGLRFNGKSDLYGKA